MASIMAVKTVATDMTRIDTPEVRREKRRRPASDSDQTRISRNRPTPIPNTRPDSSMTIGVED